MARWESGWVGARWERMRAIRGGVPDGSRALMGTEPERMRWVVLVMSRAETAEGSSEVLAVLVLPVIQRETDWRAAREASFGEEPGEERDLARMAAEAARILDERDSSSRVASRGEGGGQTQVLQ